MANLPETPQWEDGIYQIEVSDPVLGGPDGISNRQGKQLASRTLYLKQQVEKGGSDLEKHIAAADPHTQYAPKASPTFTGTPTAPTQAKTDNSTKLATTAHVKSVVADYAPLSSPALTGKPTAPTAAQTANDTQLANTAFVKAAIAALIASSPEALDTLNELAAALGNDPNFATTMTNALAQKAPLTSPALTGTPTAPTAAAGNNTTQLSTTAFVQAAIAALNNTLTTALALKAPLASPALTGTPTAPTAAQTVNNTQVATTAFVKSAVAALVDSSPAALNTLNELAAALGDDPNFSTTVMNALAGKQPLDNTLTALSGKSVTALLEYLGFVGSLTSPGYAVIPLGTKKLVIQWGTVTVPTAGSASATYLLALDLGLAQFCTPIDVSSINNYRVGVATSTKTSITLASTNTQSVTGVMWLSIGTIN